MMQITSEIGALAEALAKAQGQMASAEKGAKSSGPTKHKYSTLDDAWDACRQPLADNGLSVTQGLRSELHVVDGEVWGWLVSVTTTLMHASGGSVQETLTLPAVEQKGISMAQSIGIAATYARRYGLCAIVGITQEDNDGHVGQRKKTRPTQAAEKARKASHHASWTGAEQRRFMARLKEDGWVDGYVALKEELARSNQTPPSTWPQPRRDGLLKAIKDGTWPKASSDA